MPRVEEGPGQGGPDEPPVSNAHESLPGHGDIDRLLEFVKKQYETPGLAAYFEFKLEEAGLFSALEKAGVLPVVEDPNPFDQEREKEQHERWWEEHPEDGKRFIESFEEREKAIKHIFVGAVLGHLAGNILIKTSRGKSEG